MRLLLVALLSLIGPAAFAQDAPPAIPFDSVPNLLKLPDDMHLGEASGVAVNSKGHIFVYSRGGSSHGPAFGNTASQVLEFDANGKFVREIGKNLYAWSFAHTVRIDKDDNIWATDKGSDMIVKFNPQGRVMMVFGRKPEASDTEAKPHERNLEPPLPHQDGRFRQPTDVAWGPDGTIYISDGYVNSRVAKISKDGDWIKSWGKRGKGQGEFNSLHSIAADAKGNIYVGDRNNRRIQVFDGDGNFQREIKIDVPFDENAQPAIGNKPEPDRTICRPAAAWRRARRGRSASRRRRTRCCTRRMPIRAASTSCRSTARCWACSARRASSSSSSAGSTRSRARPRTSCSSPKS